MHPPPSGNRVQGTLDWYLTWCTLFSLTQCTLLPEREGWGAPDDDNSTMDYYSLEYVNYQSLLPKLQFIWKCNLSELSLVNNGYNNFIPIPKAFEKQYPCHCTVDSGIRLRPRKGIIRFSPPPASIFREVQKKKKILFVFSKLCR